MPTFTLPPGEYLVVAATAAGFAADHPGFAGNVICLEGTIGNGLSNSSDAVRLLAPDGSIVDAMSYGANTMAFDPPCPDVPAGGSLARVPSWQDTDSAADWLAQERPSPGGPGTAAAQTPTSTATPTLPEATSTPTATGTITPTASPSAQPPTAETAPLVQLNEILPRPDAVDWDSDGQANAYDEWVEIVNLEEWPVDLSGWAFDDIAGGGSQPYVFPPGTLLEPGGFLVRYRSTTGIALNQDTDTARLLAPDGREVDAFSYRNPRRDASYSRMSDGIGDWTDAYPPSPGRTNRPGAPTPTATPSPTPTASQTPTAISYDRAALRLNEVLPAPAAVDWNGDGTANTGDEWIELYNRGAGALDLTGWALDDIPAGGSTPYTLPAGAVLRPGGFLLIFRSQSGVALNNDADTVHLLGPDGAEVDAFAYTRPGSDRSYSRLTDGDGAWTDAYPPSPGQPNAPATPTPTATATPTATPFPAGVSLNEILPDPLAVDWDKNGTSDFRDEWIELYNAAAAPAALGGWAVADDAKTYTLPLGTVIWPQGHLLLFRTETGLSLGDRQDQVRLVRPDGRIADGFAYERGPGHDRSFCRSTDGAGAWTSECYVSPGEANRLLPSIPHSSPEENAPLAAGLATANTVAAARAAPDDTRITLTGAVTLPPGTLGRNIYIQDATGGVKVYLRTGEYPALTVGDRVRVTGWLRRYHGEVEVSVPDPSYLTRLGAGEAPAALALRTGEVNESNEGRLIWIAGRVLKFEPQALTLDDGSGPARIFFPSELPWRRPYVEIGEFWAAQGVVGQYAVEPAYLDGYRVIPRFKTDVSGAPTFLPVTGEDRYSSAGGCLKIERR